MSGSFDAIILGGGHNGLVAATLLGRAGWSVLVLERLERVGGAAISLTPFAGVDARLSRYAYLVSLFPKALLGELGVKFELRPRRVQFYAPGSGPRESLEQLHRISARVAERIVPTLTEPLRSRTELRRLVGDDEAWEALFERPLSELLERTIDSDALRGVALTDATIGTFAAADDPLLRQNRCFLYHTIGGRWDVPVGGMGALTAALATRAVQAGVEIRTNAEVTSIATDGIVAEVVCDDHTRLHARHVLANVAPAMLDQMLGRRPSAPEGSQLKINMVLSRLPRLRDSSVSSLDAFTGTFHVNEGYEQLQQAYREAASGSIPALPPCELYCHSLTDPSVLSDELRDAGVHAVSVFGLHMPARLFAADRTSAKDRAIEATFASVNSVLAEPIESCVLSAPDGSACVEAVTPLELEHELGMPGGHIFHRDLAWPFAESEEEVGRWGVETAHANVWLCGAGARRGGCVSGIPGHNAARAVLAAD